MLFTPTVLRAKLFIELLIVLIKVVESMLLKKKKKNFDTQITSSNIQYLHKIFTARLRFKKCAYIHIIYTL